MSRIPLFEVTLYLLSPFRLGYGKIAPQNNFMFGCYDLQQVVMLFPDILRTGVSLLSGKDIQKGK